MTQHFRIGIIALALGVGTASMAEGRRADHQGHDKEPQAKQSTGMKMSMPAMTDAQFVEMMTKHHQEGIELAKLEESKGAREEVKALAAKIRQGQERELQELKSQHGHQGATGGAAAGTKPQGTSGQEGHGAQMQKHHQMMNQMAEASKQKLENASGDDVDRAFLEEMSKHHQMALEMISSAKITDPELRKVAQTMADSQKKELAELKKLQQAR